MDNSNEFGPKGLDPVDANASREDKAERIENTMLAKDSKKEREAGQGMTDKEVEELANKWLADHGSADLVDPTIK